MNYTNIQLEKWKKQLIESSRRSGKCDYEIIVKKFQEQLLSGASVKLYKNCEFVVECATKNVDNKEYDFFQSENCDELKMAIKKKSKAAVNRIQSKVRPSNNNQNQNGALNIKLIKALNREDSNVILSDLSKTDKRLENSGENRSDHEISDSGPPSRNLRCGKFRKKSFFPEEPIEEKYQRSHTSNRKTQTSKRCKGAPLLNELVNSSQDNFSLQDLFNIITDEIDNSPTYREYISNGKSYIKVEQNAPNEGDVILIKLPPYKNIKTTVDMTNSKDIADLMFLPVLAEESDRFIRNPLVPVTSVTDITEYTTTTTTATTMAPLHLNGGSFVPQLASVPQSNQQCPLAFIPSNIAFYQPYVQPTNGSCNPNTLQQPYIGDGSFSIPYIFLPSSSAIEPTHQTAAAKDIKSSNTNCTKYKNCFEKRSNSASVQETSQPFPVRVTSLNGYDSTHFVNLPLTNCQNAIAQDNSQVVALNEYNTFEFEEPITIENPVKQTKKNRQSQKNQIESCQQTIVCKPKKGLSKDQQAAEMPTKLSEKESIANTSTKIACEQPQMEALVTHNASFMACLDMPLINDELGSGIYGSQSLAEQAPPVDLSNSTNHGTKQYNQFTIQSSTALSSSFLMNFNLQPTYTNSSISRNIETAHVEATCSAAEDCPVSNCPNELLERFFVGEVGEILGSETDANEIINVVQGNQIQNYTLQDEVILNAPNGSVVRMDTFDDDLLFLDDVRFNSTEGNAVTAINFNSEHFAQKNVPSSQYKNCETSKNSDANVNTCNYSLGDELFVENLCVPVQNNNTQTNDPKETCLNDNCFGVQQKDTLCQPDKTLSQSLEMNSNSVEIRNDNLSFHERSLEKTVGRDRSNVEFRNFSNAIEDHSYSTNSKLTQSSTFHVKELEHLPSSEKKLINKESLLTRKSIQQHNNYINDTFPLAQSEHTQSPFQGFSEQIVYDDIMLQSDFPEKYIGIIDTPPLSSIEESCFTYFPKRFDKKSSNNSHTPSSTNQKETILKEKENMESNENQSNTTLSKKSLTDESQSNTPGLKLSDLFLPPLELESKLNNDMLDFDCESMHSTGNSNNSPLNDENGCEIVSESNNKSIVKKANTLCRTPTESPSKRLKSWLENKNNEVGESRKTKNMTVGNHGRTSNNFKNLQQKIPTLNKLVSRRNSEICVANPKRRQHRLTIDTIPTNLFNFKNPKTREFSNETNSENDINAHIVRKHSQAPNFNTNTTDSRNKKFTTNDNVTNNNVINTLSSALCALAQNSSLAGTDPELREGVNSLTQQLLLSNASSVENRRIIQNIRNHNKDDEFPCLFQPNNQKSYPLSGDNISPTLSVEDIANFFNVTCFPSLAKQCPFGTLCPKSHKLRDTKSIRLAFQRLCIEEIEILYKFAYRYMKLYIHYFDEFCKYYAKNKKVSKLCRMFVDCQRYQKFPAHKFFTIHNCLIDCGITKEHACKAMLKHFRCRTPAFSNKIFVIIVESDWTLFVDHMKEFLSDQNVVLNQRTLEKMAKSLLDNSNEHKVRLFCKCIFKLEVQKIQGLPALKMILIKIIFLMKKINVSNEIQNGLMEYLSSAML